MKPRKFFTAMCFLCAAAIPTPPHAQDYPSRLIQFIVPATPGTVMDTMARVLGPKMSQRWGVPIMVDNKIGAGGIVGAHAVAKANPDGHTFLFVGSSFETLAASHPKLPYDPIKSFVRVSLLGTTVMSVVVSSNFPANTVREFIDQVKRRPGVFNFGSPGIGSSQHLGMELLKQETGINLVHVPYKGTAGVLNDIIAGLVQASVVALPSAVPYVQSGKLRMLAVMGTERAAKLPLVPTLAEVGVPNVIFEVWYGVMAPAGTPGAVVAKFNAEVNDLLALPDVKEVMDRQGVNPAGGKPEAFDSRVRSGIKLWTQVMTRGNIVVQ